MVILSISIVNMVMYNVMYLPTSSVHTELLMMDAFDIRNM